MVEVVAACGQSELDEVVFRGNSKLQLLLDFIMPTPKATLADDDPFFVLCYSPLYSLKSPAWHRYKQGSICRAVTYYFPRIALRCHAYFHILQHPLFEV